MGSIIIALPRKDTAGKIKEILLRHGFRDVAVVPTAAAALQETGRLSHGIIISGTKLSDMDYTDLLNCCRVILICCFWIQHRMSVTEDSRD